MANSLPYCVKKACQFLNCLHFFDLSTIKLTLINKSAIIFVLNKTKGENDMKNVTKQLTAIAIAMLIIFALLNPFFGLGHTHACCELECHVCHLACHFEYRVALFLMVLAVALFATTLACIKAGAPYIRPIRQSLTSQKIKLLN